MTDLTCFKTYDIRGEIDVNFTSKTAYKVGRAVAQFFSAKNVIIGFDARETSPLYAKAVARGVTDFGANVLDIGMAGTEEMYWAVTAFSACAGIQITASHNPINYNGIKIVKAGSKPLHLTKEYQLIKELVKKDEWINNCKKGAVKDYESKARKVYVEQIIKFLNISFLKPLKIVVNSGNGAAGPTFDAIAKILTEQHAPLDFVRVNHEPDSTFPNGIPNPLLPENHAATGQIVKSAQADFGIAFDGDFDRCFFFDECGNFVSSEYVIGIFAMLFLEKEPGAKIVHDPRTIWNIQDIISKQDGVAVQSKTGHVFIKENMRLNNAIYGGEISAHHYFRDFSYCDSGMIPWLLMAEFISRTGRSLGNWVRDRSNSFPSSGEISFKINNKNAAFKKVISLYEKEAQIIDETDGLSMAFEDWRFNLRASNTETLVRLNVESTESSDNVTKYVKKLSNILSDKKFK